MRIALIGAQGTGKSTLLEALRPYFPGYTFITEVARDVMVDMGLKGLHELKGDPERGISFQVNVLLGQIRSEKKGGRDFVSDRSILDNLVYFDKWHARNATKALADLYRAYVKSNAFWSYDLLIYCPVGEFAPVADGVRSTSVVYQQEIDGMINHVIDQCNLRWCVRKVSGPVADRVDQVLKFVEEVRGRACVKA